MQMLIEFFGFTTLANSIWNAVAYMAFIGIIIAVLWERYRNVLMTLGAAILASYAGFFLYNPLFTTLQALIVVSGLLQLMKAPKRTSMAVLMTLTVVAYLFLTLSGAVADGWALIGSLGLLGIAFGLAVLPNRYGFLLMAVGGVLLIFYAFAVKAWVFFFLNIFFAVANIRTWRRFHLS